MRGAIICWNMLLRNKFCRLLYILINDISHSNWADDSENFLNVNVVSKTRNSRAQLAQLENVNFICRLNAQQLFNVWLECDFPVRGEVRCVWKAQLVQRPRDLSRNVNREVVGEARKLLDGSRITGRDIRSHSTHLYVFSTYRNAVHKTTHVIHIPGIYFINFQLTFARWLCTCLLAVVTRRTAATGCAKARSRQLVVGRGDIGRCCLLLTRRRFRRCWR